MEFLALSVLAGAENLATCPDTARFLSVLAHLDDPPASSEDGSPIAELPERRAARGLFRFEVNFAPEGN